jgi:hypothetical protein
VVHVTLHPMINILYFYVNTFQHMSAVPKFSPCREKPEVGFLK